MTGGKKGGAFIGGALLLLQVNVSTVVMPDLIRHILLPEQ
jgi:hypothetical protein